MRGGRIYAVLFLGARLVASIVSIRGTIPRDGLILFGCGCLCLCSSYLYNKIDYFKRQPRDEDGSKNEDFRFKGLQVLLRGMIPTDLVQLCHNFE